MVILDFICYISFAHCFTLGSKLINAFNLVRMGFAYGHSPAIYNSAKYGPSMAWSMKPIHELNALASRFHTLLKSRPFGPYRATQLIFGTAAANSLAVDSFTGISQYAAPPASQRPPITLKRKSEGYPDNDISSGDDIITSSSKRSRGY